MAEMPARLRGGRRAGTQGGVPCRERHMDLAGLRERLTKLDAELLSLIAERQRLSEEVARAKRATGHPTRDFQREREVLLNARNAAGKLGLPPALADNLLRLLIRSSLATQEQAQVAAHGQGAGRRALVIGGAGKMGRWFVEFLDSQGYEVEVADPAGPPALARTVRTGNRTTCCTNSSSSRRRSESRHPSSNSSRAIGHRASCSTSAR